MAFCAQCGTDMGEQPTTCTNCGWQWPEAGAQASVPVGERMGQAAYPANLRYHISVNRVLFMTVISYGLYFFYWFYLTWRQYRDSTGQEAYPIWHTLTQFVPIYGLFRTHAHMRVYRDLMRDAGLETTIAAGWAVAAVMISSVLDWNSFRISFGSDVGQGTSMLIAGLDLVSIGITAWLLVHVQGNLNQYWHHRRGGMVAPAPTGAGEVIFAVLGVISWIGTLLLLFGVS